jgi:diguanylate cyclase (GGDEF)-like protein
MLQPDNSHIVGGERLPHAGTDAATDFGFYANVDLARARRLGSAIFAFAFLCMAALFGLSPPNTAFDDGGWAIGAGIALGALACAARLRRAGDRVSPNEMLAMSYAALAGIGALDWLAGHDSPYVQLYLLPILWTVFVHPPRRIVPFFVLYGAAIGWALHLRGGLGSAESGQIAMHLLISTGMGIVGAVLISGVRAQRAALRDAESEERRRAETDPLTGLGNRRRLMADLEAILRDPGKAEAALVVLDLDGFKAYNDSYGHPAGDELLARLGRNLDAVTGPGEAYRMGGDEFCILAPLSQEMEEAFVRRAVKALSERGEGFEITASHGVVMLPSEAGNPSDALRVADRRMYARKASQRTSAGRQSAAALIELLSQRSPALRPHSANVAELCEAVGRRMDLPVDELVPLLDAAPLHDIGKAAIPDAILDKTGALNEEELSFIRRHTLIGERILRAAPALAEAATLVRSSHERVDGKGYPDGLSGNDIPLGSRIIAACDAYDAMTCERPYGIALSSEEAISELRRMAGAQFDPDVVELLVDVLKDPASERRPPPRVAV